MTRRDEHNGEGAPKDLGSLWRSQALEGYAISVEDVRAKANKLQTEIYRRNSIEYVAGFAVIAIFAYHALNAATPTMRWGAILIIGGVLIASLFLFMRGSSNRNGAALAEDCAGFHRAALRRQREMLRGAWLWYLMPLTPGLGLFVWAAAEKATEGRRIFIYLIGLGMFAFLAALGWFIGRAAGSAARERDQTYD